MEIFGLPLQEFIFNLFLPFLLFYVLLYALLRKSKIFGEKANRLNILTALTLSAIGIISIYSLGLIPYLTWIAVGSMLAAFVGLFIVSTLGYAVKKTGEYQTGVAFMTEEEKELDALRKECSARLEELEREKDPKKRGELFSELVPKIRRAEQLAAKQKVSLFEEEWYRKYRDILRARGD